MLLHRGKKLFVYSSFMIPYGLALIINSVLREICTGELSVLSWWIEEMHGK